MREVEESNPEGLTDREKAALEKFEQIIARMEQKRKEEDAGLRPRTKRVWKNGRRMVLPVRDTQDAPTAPNEATEAHV